MTGRFDDQYYVYNVSLSDEQSQFKLIRVKSRLDTALSTETYESNKFKPELGNATINCKGTDLNSMHCFTSMRVWELSLSSEPYTFQTKIDTEDCTYLTTGS